MPSSRAGRSERLPLSTPANSAMMRQLPPFNYVATVWCCASMPSPLLPCLPGENAVVRDEAGTRNHFPALPPDVTQSCEWGGEGLQNAPGVAGRIRPKQPLGAKVRSRYCDIPASRNSGIGDLRPWTTLRGILPKSSGI